MNKIKEYKGIILIALIILWLVFYWFEWRVVDIKKQCNNVAIDDAIQNSDKNVLDFISAPVKTVIDGKYNEYAKEKHFYDEKLYDAYYKKCLRNNGL